MVVGVADRNWIEPIAAGWTVSVPLAEREVPSALAVAVIVSLPLQPVAT